MRKPSVCLLSGALLALLCSCRAPMPAPDADDIVIDNAKFVLRIGADAVPKSLIVKQTGAECLDPAVRVPLFATTQERPFNNEVKLAHPNKRTTYPANRLRREGDRLIVGFELAPYEAVVAVTNADGYAAFTLVDFISDNVQEKQYRGLQMDVPPVASFSLLRLAVRERRNFGEWLNVMWDDEAAVSVLAADPFVEIDAEKRDTGRIMTAQLTKGLKLRGATAAIAVGGGEKTFLSSVERLERDFGLPRGVESRRHPLLNASIYWTHDLNPSNVDEHVATALRGGFRMMLVYYSAITGDDAYLTIDDYLPDPKLYPGGFADVTNVLSKLKAAGITPGFHCLQTHIGLKGRYVTPVADPRLNLTRRFTLARPLGLNDDVVYVQEDPVDAPMHHKCRVLMFGGELISYERYDTQSRSFLGCRRGVYDTRVKEHGRGTVGGTLDISEFSAISCYIDQRTDLQDEIAVKIARLYDCGFEFAYFDGSEGVNPPCGIYVPYAQYRVTRRFAKPPLFTEGAAKGHFGWHLQAGANAFDIFSPEEFKAKIVEYPLAEAPRMRRNFTRLDFGWWGLYLPGDIIYRTKKPTVGAQADMWEFGTSRAAGWDCPVAVHMDCRRMACHPRAKDLLEVIRRWEDVRSRGWLTPEQKLMLRDPDTEHHLLVNGKGEYELVQIVRLPTPDKGIATVRAFAFERGGETVVAYSHPSGRGRLSVDLPEGECVVSETPDGPPLAGVRREGAALSLPLGDRLYLRTALDADDVAEAFAASRAEVVYDVRDYGAKGDGVTKDTAAIQQAIDAASGAGGGTVRLGAGTFLSGSVYLKNDVDFFLDEGATLKGSPDKEDYNPVDVCPQNSSSKAESASGSHLVLCIEQTNVTVRGSGRIDGNSLAFIVGPDGKNWPGGQSGVPWRPSQMLYFVESHRLRVEGVSLVNSPYWSCLFHGCTDVTASNLVVRTVREPVHTHNGDGIDIDCCQDVLVADCDIDTADDSLTLRGNHARLKTKRPCERVRVERCRLSSACNAVRLGVGDGIVRDAVFRDITVRDTRTAVNMVSSWRSGGKGVDFDSILFDGMKVDAHQFCLVFPNYSKQAKFRGIRFKDVSGVVRHTSWVAGRGVNPIDDVVFENVSLPCGVSGLNVKNLGISGGTLERKPLTREETERYNRDIDEKNRFPGLLPFRAPPGRRK